MVGCPYTEVKKDPKDMKEITRTQRCYVDRTTQLLTSIAIAISDIVRQKHNRMQEHKKKEMKEQMFKFEQAIEKYVTDKSPFLSHVLCIETMFFGRNRDIIMKSFADSPPTLLSDK